MEWGFCKKGYVPLWGFYKIMGNFIWLSTLLFTHDLDFFACIWKHSPHVGPLVGPCFALKASFLMLTPQYLLGSPTFFPTPRPLGGWLSCAWALACLGLFKKGCTLGWVWVPYGAHFLFSLLGVCGFHTPTRMNKTMRTITTCNGLLIVFVDLLACKCAPFWIRSPHLLLGCRQPREIN